MRRGWKSKGIKEIYVFSRDVWLGIKKSGGTKNYCIWLRKKNNDKRGQNCRLYKSIPMLLVLRKKKIVHKGEKLKFRGKKIVTLEKKKKKEKEKAT